MRLQQILAVIPVSRSTWLRGVDSGRFPASVKLSERACAWRVEEIRACIAELSGGDS